MPTINTMTQIVKKCRKNTIYLKNVSLESSKRFLLKNLSVYRCYNLALRLKKYLSTKLNCFLAYYTSFLIVDHLRLSGRYLNKRTSNTSVVDSL